MIQFACLLGCLGCLIVCWIAGGSLVAPAYRDIGTPPPSLQFKSTVLHSESGADIATWYSDRPDSVATVVLVHGLRGDRSKVLTRAERCLNAGLDVVLIDLQAHGQSSGENITIGYRERHDVTAAVDFARQRRGDRRVGVIGVSLGGAATLLATPLKVDAMVLESVYSTIEEAVSNRLQGWLGTWGRGLTWVLLCQMRPRLGFSPSMLRPIDWISRVNCPVLLAIGSDDRRTTEAEARRMFAAAPEPKEFVVFPGAGHSDLLAHCPALYDTTVIPFLVRHLGAGMVVH